MVWCLIKHSEDFHPPLSYKGTPFR